MLDAARRLPDVGITHRRTTVSTVGWVPGLTRFVDEVLEPIRLALSLHAADPALRSELMPVNERYPLADVLALCRRHVERTNRRVFVEYVMLAGVNDAPSQARELASLLGPHAFKVNLMDRASCPFKVNLIPFNDTPGSPYRGSSRAAIEAFRGALQEHGLRATVRLTRGRDIDAACGQLAARAP